MKKHVRKQTLNDTEKTYERCSPKVWFVITHFYSDPHFFHKNILKYCPNRPYKTIEEMNRAFIENYNDKVSHHSIVCWVGDAFFCDVEESKRIMNRLNGQKILVIGNHDKSKQVMADIGFSIVTDSFYTQIAGKPCFVTHYPPKGAKHVGHEHDERFNDKRPERKKGEFIIHGHTHMPKKVDGAAIHCGVDAWDFAPVSIKEIERIINEFKG